MRSLIFSISPHDWIERDRQVITSEKQRDRFIARVRNDMKEGSPELFVYEIQETGDIIKQNTG
jgi:hypothetical protein